ncbi:hypothetical protein [Streptomyces boncukensis]|uniref:Secreted protein n=1 Tax=Streptomyces boncukensis TaxID=2711219 RepID=A0A6G4X5C9_9ACTN|nr:hypothetical protein [Streptomyces boncukensis]NGO72463.1 hypothetical protein [Streptomyces boncukensis]
MGSRQLVGATVAMAVGVLALSAAGPAAADTNVNVHSPSMMCGTGPLSASGSTSVCAARQGAEQEVLKSHTRDVDLINRLEVAVPATAGG